MSIETKKIKITPLKNYERLEAELVIMLVLKHLLTLLTLLLSIINTGLYSYFSLPWPNSPAHCKITLGIRQVKSIYMICIRIGQWFAMRQKGNWFTNFIFMSQVFLSMFLIRKWLPSMNLTSASSHCQGGEIWSFYEHFRPRSQNFFVFLLKKWKTSGKAEKLLKPLSEKPCRSWEENLQFLSFLYTRWGSRK